MTVVVKAGIGEDGERNDSYFLSGNRTVLNSSVSEGSGKCW